MAKGITDKQKIMAAAVVGVAVVGVMLYLTVDAQKQIRTARAETLNSRNKSRDAQQRIKEIPTLRQKEFSLSNAVNEYVRILPTEREVNALLDTLNDLKDEAGVVLSSLKPASGADTARKKMSANFQMHTRDAKIQGPFFSVSKFVNLLERYKRFMRVESFGMKPGAEGAQVDVTLKFSTFTYQPKKIASAAPAAAKPKREAPKQ